MSALETRRSSRRQRASRAVYWRRRIAVFGSICLVVAAVVGYWFWNKPLSQGETLPEATASFDTDRFTMLVIGADDRPGEPGRSDTMMLGFVDLNQGSVKLLSIPRDSYVPIPGHGWDKINASYPLGGTALVQQTVEQLTGIPINYAVTVNMQGFQKIVDTVGGVDIDVPENMDYDDPYDDPPLHIHLKKGLQHMDGTDALHFVRFRHDAESDWGRMKRQQQFLSALAKAALQPANLTRLPSLVKLGAQNVQTNLSLGQLTKLASLAKDKMGSGEKITGETLAGNDIWAPDGYYLGLKFDEMRAKVRELAGITPDDKLLAQDKKDAAAYEAGLPKGSPTPYEESPAAPANPPVQKKPGEGTTTPGTQPGTPATGSTGAGTGTGTTTAPGTGTTSPGTGTAGTGTGTSGTGTGTTKPGTGGSTTTKPGTGTGTGSTSGGTTTTTPSTGTGTGTAPKKP